MEGLEGGLGGGKRGDGLERALVAARETRRATKGERGVDREKRGEVSHMRGGLGEDLGGDKGSEGSNQRGARRREKRREDTYMRGGPGEDFGSD